MTAPHMKTEGHVGNGELPPPYLAVTVTTQSKSKVKAKSKGKAYWSGNRWVGLKGFRIGYAQVVKWEAV